MASIDLPEHLCVKLVQAQVNTLELTHNSLSTLLRSAAEVLEDFDNPYVDTGEHELKDFAVWFNDRHRVWVFCIYLKALGAVGAESAKPRVEGAGG